jgi:regulator of sigma E protease
VISEVEEGSAAAVAGLRAGDRIISVDGVAIRTSHDLRHAIEQGASEIKVAFINGENGEGEYLMVTPRGGRIGITLAE